MVLLQWIAATAPEPWFPSATATQQAISRDALDEPLNELRLAGLVHVATWIRGKGQGYALTEDGEAALADPSLPLRLQSTATPIETPPLALSEPEAAPPTTAGIEVRPPVVTPALIAANVIWFLVGVGFAIAQGTPLGSFLSKGDTGVMHRTGAVGPFDLLNGEWWRLGTSCFVHFGAVHLLVNMLALGMMGPLAELLWGRSRLLVIYLIAGLAGSCLAMALHPTDLENGTVVMLAGASGAICGVLVALLTWLMLYRDFLPAPVAADLFRRLSTALLLTAGISLFPNVSWQGHLGGAVGGFIAAVLLNAARFGDRRQTRAASIGLVLVPLLCVGGLILAIDSGRHGWGQLRAWHEIENQVGVVNRPIRTSHDAEARVAAARAAADQFDQDVVPLLNQLAPETAGRVETQAAVLLIRPGKNRTEDKRAIRKLVEQLRALAVQADAKIVSTPTGFQAVDQHRLRAKAFALARIESYDLLLNMLDAEEPTSEQWEAWTDARRHADQLWTEISSK